MTTDQEQAVRDMHCATDAAVTKLRQNKENFNPPCCEGCFHCCYEAVYCDEFEAEYLLGAISDEDRPKVAERVKAWLEQVEKAGLLKLEYKGDIGLKWRAATVPCPLLVNGRCMVYERRPVGCRTFFAMRDAHRCAMPDRIHQKFAVLEKHPWFLNILGEYFLRTKTWRSDFLGIHLAMKLLPDKQDLESAVSEQIILTDETP